MPGVRAFWDRDKPSFLQENAESIALMISLAVVITSIYLQLGLAAPQARLGRLQRRSLSSFPASAARPRADFETLDQCNAQLAAFVGRIVQCQPSSGHINAAEFSLFNFT